MKKDLLILKVDAAGLIVQTSGIGTRKQEVEKERLRQAYAQELHLQDVAGQLLENGAGKHCLHKGQLGLSV